ncbi:MAG TPA: VTT domain-containing protein [Pseudomonadales bacterium]|nr:VTT domain-containing protein [Pseudomonadales bacterium]
MSAEAAALWLQWLSDLLGASGLDYLALFASAFLAATILPMYSEVVVVALVLGGRDPALVWFVATLGNTLGAVLNWWLGLALERWRETGRTPRWLRVPEAEFERARRWYLRFGIWSLLLAWLPVGGDALTFVAGVMRVRILPFLVLVGSGKAARYGVVVVGVLAAGA